jgi:hypothetical protein
VRGQKFWDQRLARSAIAALESAARDRRRPPRRTKRSGVSTRSGLAAGKRVPGLARRAVVPRESSGGAARGRRRRSRSRVGAGRTADAEAFDAAESVDPAPPRPEIRALDAKIASAANVPDLLAAIEQRAAAQADPRRFSPARSR